MEKNPKFKLFAETAAEPYAAPASPDPSFEPGSKKGVWDPRLSVSLATETHDHVGALRTALFHWPTARPLARAVASLSVTGRRAARAYGKDRREGVDLVSAIAGSDPARRARAEQVIQFADDVLAYLALGQDARKTSRLVARHYPELAGKNALPWLAVAPESDLPWRPVNAYASDHPTFEVSLFVRGKSIRTRYVRRGTGNVAIVLLHGLGSRLEEVERVVEHVHMLGPSTYTVFALDMLNHGYNARTSPQKELGVRWVGHERDRSDSFDMLARIQEHVAAFLDTVVRGFEKVVIGGGSLGGTTTFRLAIADKNASSNRRYMPWSPGSVWHSSLDPKALDEWLRKHGVEDRFLSDLQGPERSLSEPTAKRDTNRRRDSRFDYLCETYDDGILWFGSNASMWWGRTIDAGLKSRLIEASRRDRREVYEEAFRRTTQSLAREQMYYSVIEKERGSKGRRVDEITKPLYVLAGQEDDKPAHIRQRVEDMLKDVSLKGWATIVPKTGHSIHDERPKTLAHAIDSFAQAEWK